MLTHAPLIVQELQAQIVDGPNPNRMLSLILITVLKLPKLNTIKLVKYRLYA